MINGRISYLGGSLDESTGERTPRTASIIGEIIQPIAKAVRKD